MHHSEDRRLRTLRRGLETVVSSGTSTAGKLVHQTLDDFVADAELQDGTYLKLIRLSDAVRSATASDPGIVVRHPHVPWASLRELGDALHHRYDEVDAATIWQIFERGEVEAVIAAARGELHTLSV